MYIWQMALFYRERSRGYSQRTMENVSEERVLQRLYEDSSPFLCSFILHSQDLPTLSRH